MIDLVPGVLILCFTIGAISASLFVASLYLFHRQQHQASVAAAAGAASAAGDVPASRLRTAGDKGAAIDQASCSDVSTSSSYTCQVCGSCRPTAEGSGESCQLQRPRGCCEVSVSSTEVAFKCQSAVGSFFFCRGRRPGELLERVAPAEHYLTMAALCSAPYHLWFCPVEHPAKSRRCPDCRPVVSFELGEARVLFHQPAAAAEAERHRRCRLEGEIAEWTRGVWLLACEEEEEDEGEGREEEKAAGRRSSVIYRGDAGSVTSLTYCGRLFMYFGMPERARQRRLPACCGTDVKRTDDRPADAVCEKDDEHLPEGDLANNIRQDHQQQQQPHSTRYCRHRRDGHLQSDGDFAAADAAADAAAAADDDDDDNNGCDSVTWDSEETNSSTASRKSDRNQSPLSMGSLRKAVKWPITQIEGLIESSSSDERPTTTEDGRRPREATVTLEAEAVPPPQSLAAIADNSGVCGGDVTIQLDSLDCDNAGSAAAAAESAALKAIAGRPQTLDSGCRQ